MLCWSKIEKCQVECHTLTTLLNLHFLAFKMPEINWSKTHWNKQNIIRLALVAGIKYPNWGRKLLLKCMLWVKEKSNMHFRLKILFMLKEIVLNCNLKWTGFGSNWAIHSLRCYQPSKRVKQDKVNYAVSEREDRVTGVMTITGWRAVLGCAGLQLGCT